MEVRPKAVEACGDSLLISTPMYSSQDTKSEDVSDCKEGECNAVRKLVNASLDLSFQKKTSRMNDISFPRVA
jgi:hypothetical protein